MLAFTAAEPAFAESDLSLAEANPENPVIGTAYRGAVRARMGIRIPVLLPGSHDGWGLRMVPFIEIHNDPGSSQPLPSDNWRARARIVGSWERQYESWLSSVWVGFGIEHESDHRTAPGDDGRNVLVLNDLLGSAGVSIAPRRGELWLRTEARAYFATCTAHQRDCFDSSRSSSFGSTYELVYRVGRRGAGADAFRFFTSIHGSFIVGRGEIIDERRAVAHLGTMARRETGLWQIYGIAWVGNDVGIDRQDRVYHAGAAFAWMY